MTKRSFTVVLLGLMLAIPLSGQSKSPLHGAWTVTEVIPARGANAGKAMKPQPGIYVFTDRHYATVRVLGDTPRQAKRKDQANPTVAELMEENRIAAQGGTYEIKGDTIIFRPSVARAIANMAPGSSLSLTFKLDGNTLTLMSDPARGPSAPKTLTRIE
jgi:hypothetical protein